MRSSFLIASLWLAGFPLVAGAQSGSGSSAVTAAPVAKERPAVTYAEIERGWFLGVDAGVNFVINPPAVAGGRRPFSTGQVVRMEFGYDFGERFALSLFAIGAFNRAGSDYVGFSGGAASGDFATFIPGISGRVNAVGFADGQGIARTWIYVRLGVGYALFSPKPLIPYGDIFAFVGPGVEYYTRLRHFSVGLEVTGSYLGRSQAWGFAVTPNLRYAF